MKMITAALMLILLVPADSAADTHHDRPSTRHSVSRAPLTTTVAFGKSEVKANRIVVYSASWCAACQRLKPVVASLKKEGYKVEYRSVDKDPDQLKYQYTALPTIYFLFGEALIKKEIGYRSKEHIKRGLIPTSEPQPITTVSTLGRRVGQSEVK